LSNILPILGIVVNKSIFQER